VNSQTGYIELLKRFGGIADQRSDLGRRHNLAEILFIALVGLIAGANDAEGMVRFAENNIGWFRRIVVLKHGVPSHDTVLRVFATVGASLIEAVMRSWVNDVRAACGVAPLDEHFAVDGKTERGSFDKATGAKALHSVSVYLTEMGLTLGQQVVAEKSNEIVAIPDLLRVLNISGGTVTIDAMGCQRDIAALICGRGAHYVLHVKDNQKKLHDDSKATFEQLLRRRLPSEDRPEFDKHRDVDKGHGRIETRTCTLTKDLSQIENRSGWAGLTQIAAVAREREEVLTGKASRTVDYYIVSNANASARDVLRLVRAHWAIENRSHHVLDVSFDEDKQRVRNRNGAEGLGIMRRMAANMLQMAVGERMNIKGLRESCGWNPEVLYKVLCGEKVSVAARRRTLDPNRPRVPVVPRSRRKSTPSEPRQPT
jgi:predicted transposase YbfD/YdcC